jgi:hypothetical protein
MTYQQLNYEMRTCTNQGLDKGYAYTCPHDGRESTSASGIRG